MLKISLLFLFLLSCTRDHYEISEGKLLKNGVLFSGTREFYNGKIKRVIDYKNGLKSGKEFHFYPSGKIYKKYFYHNGMPTGKHWTYYESGKKKKFTEFENGQHHGNYIEWYESGQVYVYEKYSHGKELVHKKWRENGRIYANYVISNGRNIGLSGGKLCVTSSEED